MVDISSSLMIKKPPNINTSPVNPLNKGDMSDLEFYLKRAPTPFTLEPKRCRDWFSRGQLQLTSLTAATENVLLQQEALAFPNIHSAVVWSWERGTGLVI